MWGSNQVHKVSNTMVDVQAPYVARLAAAMRLTENVRHLTLTYIRKGFTHLSFQCGERIYDVNALTVKFLIRDAPNLVHEPDPQILAIGTILGE